ncbi:MAG: DUF4442 domain-containing protein [Kordia sp.]|nr:MAG: DUF4442 domain-containing protein [Kordia sp.]
MYKIAFEFLKRFFSEAALFKHGFNISPMYRRSVGRIVFVSNDLHEVLVKIPLNYKNRNYVGAIFGGSMFSATDPIYMIQLMNILGDDYVVWDKAAEIKYKRPARENTFAKFTFSEGEINQIKEDVFTQKEIDFEKQVNITSESGVVFAEVVKTIYISQKSYYKEKMKLRKTN